MAKAIMIQGTMSNAGKSLIAAGLCRILKQDGYKVAPFKSQNMALNSFITEDGLEMGRAQVTQAEAAGIVPSVRMNPVLLKPTSHTGSQVIVNGEVLGTISASNYYQMKKRLRPEILKAYESLAEEYEVIVIEGAGSPAEINLKEDDFVNMGMAKMAHAPVLLVGDIDRGGVFAQLYGTIALLEEEERTMIKGMIINKFRGDLSLLDSGLSMLEDLCDVPVLGVVPYLDVEIEDEDSLSQHLTRKQENGVIDIAVIRLMHLSNFTDFHALENIPGVSLRYVRKPSEFGSPDMVILPGTKNTMDDLLWMRQSGMEAVVLKAADKGTVVFGICGGYQMLGETLSDLEGVEAGGTLRGLGLLPIDTVFTKNKTRTRVTGEFLPCEGVFAPLSGCAFEGYEIHMGETTLRENGCPSVRMQENIPGKEEGRTKKDGALEGNICGTYVHGIFDREEFAAGILRVLGRQKGIDVSQLQTVDFAAFKEAQYDLLADGLRRHLDMEKIYEILEAGV